MRIYSNVHVGQANVDYFRLLGTLVLMGRSVLTVQFRGLLAGIRRNNSRSFGVHCSGAYRRGSVTIRRASSLWSSERPGGMYIQPPVVHAQAPAGMSSVLIIRTK